MAKTQIRVQPKITGLRTQERTLPQSISKHTSLESSLLRGSEHSVQRDKGHRVKRAGHGDVAGAGRGVAREEVVFAGTAERGSGRWLLELQLEQGSLLFLWGIDVSTCRNSEAGRDHDWLIL